jgi:Trk-type K+ transport system membrane component
LLLLLLHGHHQGQHRSPLISPSSLGEKEMIEAGLILVNLLAARLLGKPSPPLRVRESYIVFVALYGLAWTLLGGLIMWGVELAAGTPKAYVDCIFTMGSAASGTGLIVLDTSQLQTGSHVLLIVTLFLCSNSLGLAVLPALFKFWRYRSSVRALGSNDAALAALVASKALELGLEEEEMQRRLEESTPGDASLFSLHKTQRAQKQHRAAVEAYAASVEPLGLVWMLALVLAYYLLWFLVSLLCISLHLTYSPAARRVLAEAFPPVSPLWFAFFHSVSLFTNTGFTLLSDSLMQFSRDTFFLVTCGVVATMGFSLHPLGLRLFTMGVARGAQAVLPSTSPHLAALRSILDAPRRYYTHLFSPSGTLACVLTTLVGTFSLMCFFWGSNFELTYFRQWEPVQRAMNGWFGAVMVYNAGFNTFDVSMLSQGTLLFTLATMWYTGRPFALGQSMTANDVGASELHEDEQAEGEVVHYLMHASLNWLRNDMAVMFICANIIALVEHRELLTLPYTGPSETRGAYIGIFPIVFDLVSAYGNVGVSLGYPGTATSTCGVFHPFSKLVVLFMCLHGYCMGIFPPTGFSYELPPGVETRAAVGAGDLLADAAVVTTSAEAKARAEDLVARFRKMDALHRMAFVADSFHALKVALGERATETVVLDPLDASSPAALRSMARDFCTLPETFQVITASKCALLLSRDHLMAQGGGRGFEGGGAAESTSTRSLGKALGAAYNDIMRHVSLDMVSASGSSSTSQPSTFASVKATMAATRTLARRKLPDFTSRGGGGKREAGTGPGKG